jgi:hypothetical protein
VSAASSRVILLTWRRCIDAHKATGRISIFEQRWKFLISTGLQPGDDGRKKSESRFNGFGVQENPLKRVLSS